MPEATGRFAPLLGMLLDEARHARHDIDFLNPRRPPAPPSPRRKLIFAGAAAATVVALGAWWVWSGLARLDGEIAELAATSKKKDETLGKAKELYLAAQAIENWAKQDINWLDELRELANDLPKQQDLLLTRMNMTAGQNPGAASGAGRIELEGLMRETSTAGLLEAALRDDAHHVQGRGMTQDTSQRGYGWKFASTITIDPQTPEAYQKRGKRVAIASPGGDAQGTGFDGGNFPSGDFPGGSGSADVPFGGNPGGAR
jgi:hypothetical protein